jgi:hypothetical protein
MDEEQEDGHVSPHALLHAIYAEQVPPAPAPNLATLQSQVAELQAQVAALAAQDG